MPERSPLGNFLRFSGSLSYRALVFAVKALKFGGDVKGVIVSFLLVVGAAGIILGAFEGWWLANERWWMLVGVFLLLFFYGLCRASYEIETDKTALEKKVATDSKQEAIAKALGDAHEKGTTLKGSSFKAAQKQWVDETCELMRGRLAKRGQGALKATLAILRKACWGSRPTR